MKTALLIIDVQQGLCEGEGRAFASDEVIARLNLAADQVRKAGGLVIFVQHESTVGYLEHGSREWQLAEGLRAEPGDLRLRKTTPDSFLRTGLQELLQQHGVDQLVIGGMHSEFCVDTTTRRALALGYPVLLLEDGHTSAGHAGLDARQVIRHHNHALSSMVSFGPRARLVRCADLQLDRA